MGSRESKYEIVETIGETGMATLYRAVERDGARPVLLRVLKPSRDPRELSRLEHEFDIASRLDSPRIERPIRLDQVDTFSALVLEDPGGQPLERALGEPMELSRFFDLAIPIAEALADAHEHDLVHRDIKPETILVHEPTAEAWLIGFGLAVHPSPGARPARSTAVLEGTLAYISPEQTGRLNRSVDQRSDLYSLGVTFYRMLTGRLPFDASEPLGWIHGHIATQAPPPNQLVAAIPAPVSAIVTKLLAKEADDRYQSARGLWDDLERCRRQWRESAHIEPFELGAREARHQLRMPSKLYGRQTESARLRAAFDRVAETGSPELVAVSGSAGVGKSALIQELRRPVLLRRGFYLSAKADPNRRDTPYDLIARAFHELVLDLLASTEESIAAWRQRLLEVLGVNAQLVVDVVPAVELIIGRQPSVPALPPIEAQNRLRLVLRQFVGVVAQPEHPLVIFLDDLQWVENASLTLIEDLVLHGHVRHLLVIGAYRDDEVTPEHPLVATLNRLRGRGARVGDVALVPLSPRELAVLLADLLGQPRQDVTELAAVVHQKTRGNPFFTNQFLTLLRDEGLLAFDQAARRWRWDLPAIRGKAITENVVQLVIGKLRPLPPQTLSLAQKLACLGHQARARTLALVLDAAEEDVHDILSPAVAGGFLAQEDGLYAFLHDRVQEAVYSLIPTEGRAALHLSLGRLLHARLSGEEADRHLFEVVKQLNLGIDLVTDAAEMQEIARLNLEAGRRAKRGAAYHAAQYHLNMAMDLLAADAWTQRYSEAFAIYFESAECESLLGNFERAEALFQILHDGVDDPLDRARVFAVRMRHYQVWGRYEQGVECALEALRIFGISFPALDEEIEAAIQAEAHEVDANMAGRSIAQLIDAPVIADPSSKMTMSLLVECQPCIYMARPGLFPVASLKALNFALRHGSSEESCFAYSSYGAMLISMFGDIEAGYAFSELSLALNERLDGRRLRGRLLNLHGNYINFWRRHVSTDFPYLDEALDALLEVGDFAFAGYLSFLTVWQVFETGCPLDQVTRAGDKYAAVARESRNAPVLRTIELEQMLVSCLEGKTLPASGEGDTLTDAAFDERAALVEIEEASFGSGIVFYYVMKQIAAFGFGRYDEALRFGELARQRLREALASQAEATHHFYYGLTLAALAGGAADDERGRLVRDLEAERDLYRRWAEHCPDNYETRHALLAAEYARVSGGDELGAMRLYEQAVRAARRGGFRHWEALSNELAAGFYRGVGLARIADTYLREAHACYAGWGAAGKVAQLERLHRPLHDRRPLEEAATLAVRAEQLDALSVVRASQAISQEMDIDRLLRTLLRVVLEEAGARKGCVVIARDGELSLEAEASVSEGGTQSVSLLGSIPVAQSGAVPASVVSYAWRTEEMVLLDDAAESDRFASDPYVVRHRPKSLLCLPVIRQRVPLGLLYLDNDLVAGAFTADRLEVLELLASQAAISLDNVLLLRREQEARASAQVAEARAAFLAKASLILAEPLDREQVLGELAHLVVSRLADWCMIDLDEEGEFVRAAGIHADSSRQGALDRLRDQYPPDVNSPQPASRVIATGQPFLMRDIAPDDLRAYCVDDEHWRLVVEVGGRSGLAVPLVVRGQTLGALTMGSAKPERFAEADMELAQELAQRAALAIDSTQLIHRTQEAVRAREEFLSVASHELKTPMTSLMLALQALTATEGPTIPRATVTRLASVAERQGRRMTRLIGDLLDLTHIDRGLIALEPAEVELTSLAREVVRDLSRELAVAGSRVDIQAAGPVVGHWDRLRIEQVLTNLLSNAIKFGRGKPIEIAIRPEGDAVTIAVTDQGIGVVPEKQRVLFERFGRAVSHRHYGGLGLGLYISRGIVEAHRGSIEVESRPGQGSTFIVELPRSTQSDEPGQHAA